MHPIIGFYLDNVELTNKLGFNLSTFLEADDKWIETCHGHIQWVFPSIEPSKYNPDAPIPTSEVIQFFKENELLRERMRQAYRRMCTFYGFNGWIREHWVTPKNHNFLRITRMLKCFNLFGLQEESVDLFADLTDLYQNQIYGNIITPETYNYWKEAAECGT